MLARVSKGRGSNILVSRGLRRFWLLPTGWRGCEEGIDIPNDLIYHSERVL